MRNHILILMSLVLSAPNSFSQPWQKVEKFDTYFPTYLYTDSINSSLLFTGRFVEINDNPYFGVAELKTDSFYQLGCGINWNCVIPYNINIVYGSSIINYNSEIYVTGNFNKVGNIPAKSIGKWDGQNWASLGSGLSTNSASNGTGNILKEIENELYLGGSFDSAFGMSAHSLVKYDGLTWSPVFNIPEFSTIGSANNIYQVVKYQDKLYVGGQFYSGFPITTINALAVYNDTNWVKVGTGIPNPNDVVYDMVVYKGELIVGGSFTKQTHPQNPGNCIAAWDGSNWHSLGDASQNYGLGGPNASVSRMIVHNDYLYVCGRFSTAGGNPVTSVARWDGTNWCALATGFTGFATEIVYSLAFYGDTLFAVGEFSNYAGDTNIRYAAKLPNPDSSIINCTSVGINTYRNNINLLKVTPNPSTTTISIQELPERSRIEFFNTLGQLELNIEVIDKNAINIEKLSSGLHYLKVYNSENNYSHFAKLIKLASYE